MLFTFNSRHDDSPASPLDALSTWQCNPEDGSVSKNGVTIDAFNELPLTSGLVGERIIPVCRRVPMDVRSRWWPGFCAPTKVWYQGSVPRFGTMRSGDSCASSNSGFWTLPENLEHRGNRTQDRSACLSQAVPGLRSLQLCLGVQRAARMRVVLEVPSFGRAYHPRWWPPDLRVRYDHYPAKQGYGRASSADVTANAAQKQCPPTCRDGLRRLEATLTWARGPPA
jgi:hypothetical protein